MLVIREEEKRRIITKGCEKTLGLMGKFITFVLVIVSWVYTFVETSDSSYQLLQVSYFLVKSVSH